MWSSSLPDDQEATLEGKNSVEKLHGYMLVFPPVPPGGFQGVGGWGGGGISGGLRVWGWGVHGGWCFNLMTFFLAKGNNYFPSRILTAKAESADLLTVYCKHGRTVIK